MSGHRACGSDQLSQPTPFTVALDGARLAGIEAGEGLPVVFLHAGVADKRIWARQVTFLAQHGYRALAYDRRGYGESQAEPEAEFAHLDDLEDVLDAQGIRAAVLVGNSMGGGLAIDFALANPERVAGLVLIGTAVSGAPEAELSEDVMPMIHAMQDAEERGDLNLLNAVIAHAWLDGPLSPNGRVGGEARALFLDMNGKALAHPELTGEDESLPAYDDLADIETPTLLLVGDLDFPDIVALHEELSETLPNAFAMVLEGVAHLPSLEKPELFESILLEFLQAL